MKLKNLGHPNFSTTVPNKCLVNSRKQEYGENRLCLFSHTFFSISLRSSIRTHSGFYIVARTWIEWAVGLASTRFIAIMLLCHNQMLNPVCRRSRSTTTTSKTSFTRWHLPRGEPIFSNFV